MKKTFLLFIAISFFQFFFLFALEVNAQTTYTPLAPIGDYVQSKNYASQDGLGFSDYLANIYRLGIGIATALSVLMIMWGGIEYMSTDAMGGKEEGRERINNALVGLMLALASYVILVTINRQFINTRLDLGDPVQVAANEFRLSVDSYDKTLGGGTSVLVDYSGTAPAPGGGAITQSALAAAAAGYSTANIPGLDGGNLGCAYAVSYMLKNAGYDIGTITGTEELYSTLASDPRFTMVATGAENAQPGDIIIARGGGHGHAAISTAANGGEIVGNRSSLGKVAGGWSATSWNSFFGSKGKTTYVFRASK